MAIQIRPGTACDGLRIRELLETADLPTEDLAEANPQFVVATQDAEQLVGTGALQWFETVALLRSVAVSPPLRCGGLGRRIVTELEALAREAKVNHVILLTTTARAFFERLGYSVVERQGVPSDVQQSAEFRSLCPASAACMAKYLR